MRYDIIDNKIIIKDLSDFNVEHILECGQIFRYKKTDFGYQVVSLHHKADIYCHKDMVIIKSDDSKYFENFFDLKTDYDKIKLELEKDLLVGQAIKFGYGIRILKQNYFEMLVSFIISANNNIPRIKNSIEYLSKNFGKNMGDYYAFPTLSELSNLTIENFKDAGCGYRSAYLVDTILKLKSGFDLLEIYDLDFDGATQKLLTLKGVGQKVADCVLLFGYYNMRVFPTDTWIIKVYNDFNENEAENQNINPIKMRKYFVERFGDLSGYAQQYLFYNKRSNKNIEV